ncbi:hypothetical protein, partial [Burkholderia thailandensis]|uniref:hypothetical protein n=1 Tax=Burkholderia thailandensis TaxID=57975 RepID=UPI001E47849F
MSLASSLPTGGTACRRALCHRDRFTVRSASRAKPVAVPGNAHRRPVAADGRNGGHDRPAAPRIRARRLR